VLTPVILATQEAEIRRIRFEASSGKWFSRSYPGKRGGGVAQGEGPEFKPQYRKRKKVQSGGNCARQSSGL
jgi:hypothetical protein